MPALRLDVASGAPLDVRRFVIEEAISEPFLITVMAHCHDPALDLDAIVGHPASFHVESGVLHARKSDRRWEGVCRAAALTQVEATGISTYHFELVPSLWLLTQRRDHRILQHRSAPAIAAGILDAWQIARELAADEAAYPPLPYKVQYGETDHAFFCRILEEAGLTHTFPEVNGASGPVHLSDRLHEGAPRPPVPFEPSPSEAAEREFVTEIRLSADTRPGAFALRDHDLRRPDFPLFAEADKAAPPEGRLEQYHYRPGASLADTAPSGETPAADDQGAMRHDRDQGRRFAARGLAGERAGRRLVSYRTNALDLSPGQVFTVTGHPHPDLPPSRRLLASRLTIEGAAGEAWTTRGQAVFADSPYHPPRRTPRPQARIQTATVTGPSGDDVHTDELGRVRVRFPWDRGVGSTIWIRVSQAWAGSGYGMMTLPRAGQEVLVDFLEGDPEQPVVVGRVHNRVNPVIERLPEHRTKSAWKSDSSPSPGGFNEILYEDRKGSELLFAQAEQDARRLVKHDDTSTVVRDREKRVANDERETTERDRAQVTERERIELSRRDRLTAVEGTRRDKVKREAVDRIEAERRSLAGKDRHRITAGTRRALIEHDAHLTIEKSRQESVGGTDALNVGDRFDISTGGYTVDASGPEGTIHLVAGSAIVIESSADVSIKAGGSFVSVFGGTVNIEGPDVAINEGGSPGSLPGPGPALPDRPKTAVVDEPPAPKPKPTPEEATGSYEIVVVDEFEKPIRGLGLTISTPAGTTEAWTDADGRVRIDTAPPPTASAWVTRPPEIASLLAGRERGPRREAKLPEGEAWHIRTPTDLSQTIVLPEGKPQKLMIVTRTDLTHHAARSPWTGHALAEGGPVALEEGDPVFVAMSSDATAAEAVVQARATKPGSPSGTEPTRGAAEPPEGGKPGSGEWLRAGVDGLHDALFQGAFDTVFQILESIPLDPPRPTPEAPDPAEEQRAFEEASADLARQGVVDYDDGEDIGQV